jgi:hypothetical protein
LAYKKAISFSFSALAFVLGCFIYFFLRQPPIIFHILLSDKILIQVKNFSASHFSGIDFPEWTLYNLPDLLWMFAFIMTIFALWDFKLNRDSLFWLVLCSGSGLLLEFLQLYSILPGSFDVYDLIFLFTGAILPFLLEFKNIIYEKKY